MELQKANELKEGCGKALWCADIYGYVPICGKDNYFCKDCLAKANLEKLGCGEHACQNKSFNYTCENCKAKEIYEEMLK